MITIIGVVAGEIWSLLEEKGDLPLDELKEELLAHKVIVDDIEVDEKVIYMGLGWLVREGFVRLAKEAEGFRVCLMED